MSKVMIIEDERDLVYFMRVMLEKHDFEVMEAFNGKDAYETLSIINTEKELPDLLVMDVMMPGMDGYTLQAKLQENDKLKNIPIIILSAKGNMRDLFELASNVFAFTEKPFDPNSLVKLVKDAIDSGK